MNGEQTPMVSIGLPVRNGMPYLVEALDSILAQTYTDFELIICDNASTDETQAVCREYSARDGRILYYRNAEDIGGGNNHNLTFKLSRGKYFHWAGSDDVLAPTFIERCVNAMDTHPEVSVCHTWLVVIDEAGAEMARVRRDRRRDLPKASLFSHLISFDHDVEDLCGLVRSSELSQTRLLDNYTDCDRTLLAQLALRGSLYEVPEWLFYKREHAGTSTSVYPDWRPRMRWFGEKYASPRRVPHWRQLIHYLEVIATAPVPKSTKVACFGHMLPWAFSDRRWRWLLKDLAVATRDLLPRSLAP